jgi:hypothetical protein
VHVDGSAVERRAASMTFAPKVSSHEAPVHHVDVDHVGAAASHIAISSRGGEVALRDARAMRVTGGGG